MSSNYLKVTIEKKRCTENFDFLNLKNSLLGELQLLQISFSFQTSWFKILINIKYYVLIISYCVPLFYLFYIRGYYYAETTALLIVKDI